MDTSNSNGVEEEDEDGSLEDEEIVDDDDNQDESVEDDDDDNDEDDDDEEEEEVEGVDDELRNAVKLALGDAAVDMDNEDVDEVMFIPVMKWHEGILNKFSFHFMTLDKLYSLCIVFIPFGMQ